MGRGPLVPAKAQRPVRRQPRSRLPAAPRHDAHPVLQLDGGRPRRQPQRDAQGDLRGIPHAAPASSQPDPEGHLQPVRRVGHLQGLLDGDARPRQPRQAVARPAGEVPSGAGLPPAAAAGDHQVVRDRANPCGQPRHPVARPGHCQGTPLLLPHCCPTAAVPLLRFHCCGPTAAPLLPHSI